MQERTSDVSDICEGFISFWLKFYNDIYEIIFHYILKYSGKSEIFSENLMEHNCLCNKEIQPTVRHFNFLNDITDGKKFEKIYNFILSIQLHLSM